MTKNRKFYYPPQPKKRGLYPPPPPPPPPPVFYDTFPQNIHDDFLSVGINGPSTHPKFQEPCPTSENCSTLDHKSDMSTLNGLIDALEELELLEDIAHEASRSSENHEMQTAPILTRDAYIASSYGRQNSQYGVLGQVISSHSKEVVNSPSDPRLYLNTNAPFSAVICGVQGSGKSHTLSIILENMLISRCPQIGSLEKPLCGLVLHFGEGGPNSQPSEASWIGVPSIPGLETPRVRVYVSRSSLNTMKKVYAPLGGNVTVEPLLFDESELDAGAFLSMMAVGTSESAPLYVQIILSILRDLGEEFTFKAFTAKLEEGKRSFNPAQLAGLEQRMSLLMSFMTKRKPPQPRARFSAGELSIVDLSDPFVDSTSACSLFEIITRLFVRADVGTGKVLVVDEAHKYLSGNRGMSGLTKSLLTLTREQRHLGMRVILCTQEPTVIPPVLLDLCTVAILHRFSSPSWWDHLSNHVSADISADDAFDKVVRLKTGQAIILAPSGLEIFKGELNQLGRRYLMVKTRKRVTSDGGASVLVLER